MTKNKWYYLTASLRTIGAPEPVVSVHGSWDSEEEAYAALMARFEADYASLPDTGHPLIEFAVAKEKDNGTLTRPAWLSPGEDPDEVDEDQPGLFG